jgi:hypothetical protein
MSAGRPNLAQEKMLWAIALAHFGPSELHKVVNDIWSEAKPPDRPLVETLDTSNVGSVVLNILKTAQAEIGATVPHRQPGPGQVVMYSRHAQLLTDGLLDRIPAQQLPKDLRGFKVQVAMGV